MAIAFVAIVAVGMGPVPASAAGATPAGDCGNPTVPEWFHDNLVESIDISGDLPRSWARSPHIARIVCWQGTGFDRAFREEGDAFHIWHGIFAMTTHEVQTIMGPWMIRDRYGYVLSTKCFVHGWSQCSRIPEHTRLVQETIAGLRWIWLNFGRPKEAWAHITRTGRFNSYPRRGTDDGATTTPLGLCPVAGTVGYDDDFGEPRYTGGYHPHWGNDVGAPIGREIRAPFDGLAVAHTDNWLGGNYLTVVGAKGYVRNGHLSRFGTLGYVEEGTVVGYVGETGNAAGPHDHFEWHPWVVPTPLHQAPSGFTRVMDAIDPFPFLNQVCTRSAARGDRPALEGF